MCPRCQKKKVKTVPAPRVKIEDAEDYQENRVEKPFSHLPSPTGNVNKHKPSKKKKDGYALRKVAKDENPKGDETGSRILHCPIEGCECTSENRTSLLSHAWGAKVGDHT